MKLRSLAAGTLLLCSQYPLPAFPMEPAEGQTSCVVVENGDCRIAWNLAANPRTKYQVERFDVDKRRWVVEHEDNNSYGISSSPAVPGSLYRVTACDLGSETDCTSTTAYWTPVLPDGASDIPSFVYRKNGDALSVSKSTRLRTQILQYNVYLFVRDFEDIDLSQFPEMSNPPDMPTDLIDIVHYNIYPNYKGYRDTALGNPPMPGPEYPDARPIHPEGHPEREHSHDQG